MMLKYVLQNQVTIGDDDDYNDDDDDDDTDDYDNDYVGTNAKTFQSKYTRFSINITHIYVLIQVWKENLAD